MCYYSLQPGSTAKMARIALSYPTVQKQCFLCALLEIGFVLHLTGYEPC